MRLRITAAIGGKLLLLPIAARGVDGGSTDGPRVAASLVALAIFRKLRRRKKHVTV